MKYLLPLILVFSGCYYPVYRGTIPYRETTLGDYGNYSPPLRGTIPKDYELNTIQELPSIRNRRLNRTLSTDCMPVGTRGEFNCITQ